MPVKENTKPDFYASYQEEADRIAKERRLRPIMRRLSIATFITGILLFCGLITYLLYYGYFAAAWHYTEQKYIQFTSRMGLNLEFVYVDGVKHLSTRDVMDMVPRAYIGADAVVVEQLPKIVPLFSISLPKLREQIEDMGWVKQADVERQLPNALHIRIVERIPAAIWQYKGSLHLMDGEGEVIQYDQVTGFTKLPVIVGNDVHRHVSELLRFIGDEPRLAKMVESMIWVSNRRWNIRLSNGVEVKLPEKDPATAWRKLAEMDINKKLLSRAIKTVDMRDGEKLYMQLMDEAVVYDEKKKEAEKLEAKKLRDAE